MFDIIASNGHSILPSGYLTVSHGKSPCHQQVNHL